MNTNSVDTYLLLWWNGEQHTEETCSLWPLNHSLYNSLN